MTKALILFTTAICIHSAMASAYFENITNLWFNAQHTHVLNLAEQRLTANTNDIAGILMKASWDFVYANPSELSNSLDRVVAVGLLVTTPAFTNQFRITAIDVERVKDFLAAETDDDRAEILIKATRPGRLPHYVRELKALDDDGYFTE